MLLESRELNIMHSIQLTEQEFRSQILLMAALKMFELEKLSSGKAAELAGVSRVQFLELCGIYKVPVVNFTKDEIQEELSFLSK